MTKKILIYYPGLSVKATISSGQDYDLTPDVVAVQVAKNIEEPAGMWGIHLVPRERQGLDWYYKLSPMDYVEIRFAREPHKYGGKLPIVMRGFVDNVQRDYGISQDGKPRRTIIVNGRDFGKILGITNIWYSPFNPETAQYSIIPKQALNQRYSMKLYEDSLSEIMATIFANIALPQYQTLSMSAKLPSFGFVGSSKVAGRAFTFGIQPYMGTVWELFQIFRNAPWNELFIRDYDNRTSLIFRLGPMKDIHGKLIQGIDNTAYEHISDPLDITDSVDHLSLGRSDNEISNWYQTYPGGHIIPFLSKIAYLEEGEKTNPYRVDDADPYAGANIYGRRPLERELNAYLSLQGLSDAEKQKKDETGRKTVIQLNQYMVAMFRHNVLFESGSISLIKGDERIKPGYYVKYKDSEYYVNGVQHTFVPLETFSTTLTVSRGINPAVKKAFDSRIAKV